MVVRRVEGQQDVHPEDRVHEPVPHLAHVHIEAQLERDRHDLVEYQRHAQQVPQQLPSPVWRNNIGILLLVVAVL